VEKGELRSPETARLVESYVAPLIAQGADTLVLGCTHYPFVEEAIRNAANRAGATEIELVDTGVAVARQLRKVLTGADMLRDTALEGTLSAFTSGSRTSLAHAFDALLKIHPPIEAIAAPAAAGNTAGNAA
jgi:glutamate racemase